MMKNKQKIAVTGGIGSGKSTVCKIIKELGYPVCSCDEIYAGMQRETDFVKQIERLFPDCVDNGVIDKRKLSSIVFSNKDLLQKLNAISHPQIMQRVHRFLDEQENDLVFAEVPLLFEGGYEKDFDRILVVTRDKAARVSSVANRDGLSVSQITARISNQIDHAAFIKGERVFEIKNEGDLSNLKKATLDAITRLKKRPFVKHLL